MPVLRDLDLNDTEAIAWVARGMRATLVEVEGTARGEAMYTLDWLADRVRWHLQPGRVARVVLGVDDGGMPVGHCIARVEAGEESHSVGLVSTTYVVPAARRQGWAQRFLEEVETWLAHHGVTTMCTWTSATNQPLISLYRRNGYRIVDEGRNDLTGPPMVKLSRHRPRPESPATCLPPPRVL